MPVLVGEQFAGPGFGTLQLPIPAWTCRPALAPAQEFRAELRGQCDILAQESCRKIRFRNPRPILQHVSGSGLVLLIKLDQVFE